MRQNLVRRRLSLILVPGVIALSGCNPPSPPAIPALSPLPNGTTAAPARISGAIGATDALPSAGISYGRDGAASANAPVVDTAPGDVSLDFADTDIREVVAQILGTLLKVNYTIDPAVHGSATLHTARPLNRSQLMPTLEVAAGAERCGTGYRWRALSGGAGGAGGKRSRGGSETAGAVVVPLHYASAEDLAKVLQPYVGEGGKIAADPGRNAC